MAMTMLEEPEVKKVGARHASPVLRDKKLAVIDCDIHNVDGYQSPATEVWVDYMPSAWRDYHLSIAGAQTRRFQLSESRALCREK